MDTEPASGPTPASRRPRRSRGALLALVALPLGLGVSAVVVANRGAEGRVALAATAALIVGVVALRALTRRIVSPLLYSVAFLLVLWLFSPAERLVFVSDRDTPGRPQVFTVDASGGDVDRLGATLGQDDAPVISPDGRRLALSRRLGGQERLFIAGSRGGGATPVPHGEGDDHHPAWSPDGRWLAFASDRGGDWEIYVMALDGSGLRDLSHHPARDDWPAWSPDGRRLAFESERGGRPGIYLVRLRQDRDVATKRMCVVN